MNTTITRRKRLALACVVAGLALTTASCGPSGRRPVYPAHGQVLFNGRPIAQAFVVLHPVGQPQDAGTPNPSGRTDRDGRFRIAAYSAGDGAPAGDYVLTVEWRPIPRGSNEDIGSAPNQLPDRYGRPESSGVQVHVQEGDNEIPTVRIPAR